VEGIVLVGAGLLLSVLWFDLMFDVQVRGNEGDLPDEVLESISTYYRRVTTDARPMNRFVSVAMVVTLGGIVAELVGDTVEPWVGLVSLLLALPPIVLAGARIFPAAVSLGQGAGDIAQRSAKARYIHRTHWFCWVSIAALIAVQLVSVAVA
jgi:hypothetical protein